jgi:hypothetical protein
VTITADGWKLVARWTFSRMNAPDYISKLDELNGVNIAKYIWLPTVHRGSFRRQAVSDELKR